ncbi:MAG: hypothetical protein ABI821_04030 [Pseudomonadota bacterium]
MRFIVAALLLAQCLPLSACKKEVTRQEVAAFVDKADNAARKRFAPEICELRGKDFRMKMKFQGHEARMEPTQMEIGRKLYCANAGSFSRLRQYKLERTAMDIDIATDRRTARVTADYIETMPYYEPGMMPATPDDFTHFQVVESRDESVVGVEDGDLVFLSTEADAHQSLILKSSVAIPYD